MLIEAGIILFLTYWVMSEYTYSAFFHSYVDQALLSHVTSYTAILGLGVGLAGSAAAVTLYKILSNSRHGLERTAVPSIRVGVENMIASLPGASARPSSSVAIEPKLSDISGPSAPPPVTVVVPVPEKNEPKKDPS